MKKWIIIIIFILMPIYVSATTPGVGFYKNSPTLNNDHKWRIAYLEGGEYFQYPEVLKGIVEWLMDNDWIEKKIIPEKIKTSKQVWSWLSTGVESDYITFIDNAFWSSEWLERIRQQNRSKILWRIHNVKDIDLFIANGTWAGQDLANNLHKIPVVVCSASDPVASRIILSVEDSGYDHVHARVDPYKYQNQLRLFHRVVNFKRLGIVYVDTLSGKSYAALPDVYKMSEELNFRVITCTIPEDILADESALLTERCHEKLISRGIDALYLTTQIGVTLKSMSLILKPLYKEKIPIFSQTGTKEVKYGCTLSMSQANYRYESNFYASVIARIFNGEKPRNIRQIFEEPQKIVVNNEVLKMMNLVIPNDIKQLIDEEYDSIFLFNESE